MNSHVVEYCAILKRRRDDLYVVTSLHNNMERSPYVKISRCRTEHMASYLL